MMFTPDAAAAVGILGYALGIATARIAERRDRADDQTAIAAAVGVLADPPAIVDHVHCEGQCGLVLCNCLPLFDRPRCTGTVEQVCGHNNPLCEGCAQTWCIECLAELGPSWIGGVR